MHGKGCKFILISCNPRLRENLLDRILDFWDVHLFFSFLLERQLKILKHKKSPCDLLTLPKVMEYVISSTFYNIYSLQGRNHHKNINSHESRLVSQTFFFFLIFMVSSFLYIFPSLLIKVINRHKSENLTDPGMQSRRFPPAFMLRMPSSSPLITCSTSLCQ